MQGRDLSSFVQEARERIARDITLEQGMTIEWSGQYENQLRAQHSLQVIVPVVFGVIYLLLFIVCQCAVPGKQGDEDEARRIRHGDDARA